MLADTLTETCDAIEEYLIAYPETYAHCLEEIRAVYAAIVTLRRKLDDPLGYPVCQVLDAEEEYL
jgi:hypothetical protein